MEAEAKLIIYPDCSNPFNLAYSPKLHIFWLLFNCYWRDKNSFSLGFDCMKQQKNIVAGGKHLSEYQPLETGIVAALHRGSWGALYYLVSYQRRRKCEQRGRRVFHWLLEMELLLWARLLCRWLNCEPPV